MNKKRGLQRYSNVKGKVRSGYEAQLKADLDERKVEYGYETIKLKYTRRFCKSCGEPIDKSTYTPDFILHGRVPVVVEAKGRFTSADRTKMRCVKEANPEIDIRLIFQRNQFIKSGSKTRYTDWCDKQGFLWAVGNSIPQEWIPRK